MLRGLIVWLIIMAAETVHGILRGLFLAPHVGVETASRLGWPVGMAIVVAIAVLMARWVGLRDTPSLLRLGVLWAILTVLFEIAIGVLRGLDSTAIWTEINPLAGGMMVYSLAVMLLAPLIAWRLRFRS